eukprot:4685072-Amphidinium_carterae.1
MTAFYSNVTSLSQELEALITGDITTAAELQQLDAVCMPAMGWPCSMHTLGESACEDKTCHRHWLHMMCHHVMP